MMNQSRAVAYRTLFKSIDTTHVYPLEKRTITLKRANYVQNKPVHVSTFGSSVRLCSEMVERVRTAVIPAKLFLFIRL